MKKIIFGFSCIMAIVLLVNIARILLKDFHRLTEYGFGYLAGLIVLFLVFLILCIVTGRKLLKKA